MLNWKSYLENLYGETIDCRVGESSDIEFNRQKTKQEKATIAIYIHPVYNIAVIWDLENRKKLNKSIKNPTLNYRWEELLPCLTQINAFYIGRRNSDGTYSYEKVLAVKTERLLEVLDNYSLYSAFNPLDLEFPRSIKSDSPDIHWCPDEFRNRVSTERWMRDARFRTAVLESYHSKCAICRCQEEKLLEAAHIVAVADGGSDCLENGICLCANHHIMFDKGLIRIDHRKHELTYVAESVKCMPWYIEFCNKYKGKVMERQTCRQ